MGTRYSGRDKRFIKVQNQLRAMGLPDTLFDADFGEQLVKSVDRAIALSKEVEPTILDDLSLIDLVRLVPGEGSAMVVQGNKTMKERLHRFRESNCVNRMFKTGIPCKPGSKNHAYMTSKGYDIEATALKREVVMRPGFAVPKSSQ
jgi:hypothetical protein